MVTSFLDTLTITLLLITILLLLLYSINTLNKNNFMLTITLTILILNLTLLTVNVVNGNTSFVDYSMLVTSVIICGVVLYIELKNKRVNVNRNKFPSRDSRFEIEGIGNYYNDNKMNNRTRSANVMRKINKDGRY